MASHASRLGGSGRRAWRMWLRARCECEADLRWAFRCDCAVLGSLKEPRRGPSVPILARGLCPRVTTPLARFWIGPRAGPCELRSGERKLERWEGRMCAARAHVHAGAGDFARELAGSDPPRGIACVRTDRRERRLQALGQRIGAGGLAHGSAPR